MFGRDWESASASIVARRLVDKWHGGEGGHVSGEVYEYVPAARSSLPKTSGMMRYADRVR